MQVIDGRDQGDFVVHLLERGGGGTFHTVSPAPPFSLGDLLEATASVVAPPGTKLHWVDGEGLVAEGLDDSAFPFWATGGEADSSTLSAPTRPRPCAAGLAVRPLRDNRRATPPRWVRAGPRGQPRRRGSARRPARRGPSMIGRC